MHIYDYVNKKVGRTSFTQGNTQTQTREQGITQMPKIKQNSSNNKY